MNDIEEEVLRWNLEVDPRKAVRGFSQFQKKTLADISKVDKKFKDMNRGIVKFGSQLFSESAKMARKRLPEVKKELEGQYKELNSLVSKYEIQMEKKWREIQSQGEGSDSKTTAKLKKELEELTGLKESMESQLESTGGRLEGLEGLSFDTDALVESAKEAGEELAEPLEVALSKDAMLVFRRGSELLAGGLKKGLGNAGTYFKNMSAKKMESGNPVHKAMGKMSGVIGGAMEKLAGLGPIIQMASGFMASFIKIALDAEAAVKGYNKELLAVTSTGGYLADNFSDVSKSSNALLKDLNDARAGALAFSNVQWGISKETAASFQTAMAQEGVSLRNLGKETERATGYATDHAKVIQMGVAYSRAFGSSLSEVTQLQGEMMSETGASLDTVQASFQNITQSAQESGYAANKFFGIVKSFSSDLTLFTLRMEEVTKVLKVMGQSMSPRSAQKFMQTLAQRFTGGVQDNLKFTIMGGEGTTRDIAQKDLTQKLAGLRQDVANAMGAGNEGKVSELFKLLSDPKRDPRALAKWQAENLSPEMSGIKESVQDAALMIKRLADNTAIDTASVLDQLSPLAKMQILQQNILKLTGKKFDELTGIDLAAAENSGIASAKEVRENVKFYNAMLAAQEEMAVKFEKGLDTEEDRRKARALGLNINSGTRAQTAEELRTLFKSKGGEQKFWDVQSATQQDLLAASVKQIDYQRETSSFQTSTLDELSMLSDILLNKIYDILTSIWDTLKSFWRDVTFQGGSRESKVEHAAEDTGNEEIIRAFKSKADVFEATKAVIQGPARQMLHDIESFKRESEALKARLESSKDDYEMAAIRKRLDELEPLLSSGLSNLNETNLWDRASLRKDQGTGLISVMNTLGHMSKLMPKQMESPFSGSLTPAPVSPIVTTASTNTAPQATPQAQPPIRVEVALAPGAEKVIDAKVTDGIANHYRNRNNR